MPSYAFMGFSLFLHRFVPLCMSCKPSNQAPKYQWKTWQRRSPILPTNLPNISPTYLRAHLSSFRGVVPPADQSNGKTMRTPEEFWGILDIFLEGFRDIFVWGYLEVFLGGLGGNVTHKDLYKNLQHPCILTTMTTYRHQNLNNTHEVFDA